METLSEKNSANAETLPNQDVIQLEKLLKKQKKEMQTTEYLIQKLKSRDNPLEESSEMQELDESILGLQRSLLAGEDYGFKSKSEGSEGSKDLRNRIDQMFEGYAPPGNMFTLAKEAFERNLESIVDEKNERKAAKALLTKRQLYLQKELKKLTLNTKAIWEKEGEIDAPWIIKAPYLVLCYFLDVVFEGRYIPSRFYLLETVARVPYFSYISMLHLYESLGWWRRSAEVKRVHFAEENNEFHHLLIAESLGGDQKWSVRFLAQHSALAYYVVLVILWLLSPSLSYKFSELLETHAVHTYTQLLEDNEVLLKSLPPPSTAVEYYALTSTDPLFNDYQTDKNDVMKESSGSNMTSLYKVFEAIRNDEGEHVSTMKSCLDPQVAVLSPSIERSVFVGAAVLASIGLIASGNVENLDDITSLIGPNGISDIAPDILSGGETELTDLIEEESVNALIEGSFLAVFFDQIRVALIELLESL